MATGPRHVAALAGDGFHLRSFTKDRLVLCSRNTPQKSADLFQDHPNAEGVE